MRTATILAGATAATALDAITTARSRQWTDDQIRKFGSKSVRAALDPVARAKAAPKAPAGATKPVLQYPNAWKSYERTVEREYEVEDGRKVISYAVNLHIEDAHTSVKGKQRHRVRIDGMGSLSVSAACAEALAKGTPKYLWLGEPAVSWLVR